MRELAEVVTEFGGPDGICETLGFLGTSCVSCSDGEAYCMDTEIQSLQGGLVDETVVRVTEECR